MSVQTPADIADKYFLNTDMRNALRNDIEDLYNVKGAEIRAGCVSVVLNSIHTSKEDIASDVEQMLLPDLTEL